jgi:hypothetical protein
VYLVEMQRSPFRVRVVGTNHPTSHLFQVDGVRPQYAMGLIVLTEPDPSQLFGIPPE